MKDLLLEYERASGQKIKNSKLGIVFSRNVASRHSRMLRRLLGVRLLGNQDLITQLPPSLFWQIQTSCFLMSP